jgi:glutathionylspermidine synthase
MYLEAVDRVVNDDTLLKLFAIPYTLWKPIKDSWSQKQFDLQGDSISPLMRWLT